MEEEEREGGPLGSLPGEIWGMVVDYVLYELTLKRIKVCSDTTPYTPPSLRQWRQLVDLLMVCKDWYAMVWDHVRGVECGREGGMPYDYVEKVVIPKAGNHLATLYIWGDGGGASTSFFKKVSEYCPHLVSLFISNSMVEGVMDLFHNYPTTWTTTLRHLGAHRLHSQFLQVITHKPMGLTRLTALNLRRSKIPGDSLSAVLSQLQSLTHLDLFDVASLEGSFWEKTFPSLPSLTSLHAGKTAILGSTESINALVSCTKLKELRLPGFKRTPVRDPFALFSRLTELELLDVSFIFGFTKREWKHIARIPNLTNLKAHGVGLTAEGLSALAPLSNTLKKLKVTDFQQSDESITTHLSSFTNLHSLALRCTDEATTHLSSLTNLNSLGLGQSIRGKDLVVFSLPKLTRLEMGGESLEDEAIEWAVRCFPSLTSLDLAASNTITDDGLSRLSDLKNLTILDLGGCELITDDCLQHIGKCTGLRLLDLVSCSSLTEEGIAQDLTPLILKKCHIQRARPGPPFRIMSFKDLQN